MELPVLGGLAALALVDSTSFGTLVLPLVMLALPGIRAGRVLVYLATIAVFYWLLGLALLSGLPALLGLAGGAWQSEGAYWVQLVVGVMLLVISFWPDTPLAKRRAATRAASGRKGRWERALTDETATVRTVAGVALLAGLVEAASMLPYLGAVGLLTTSSLPWIGQAAVLVAYVVVMCLPALVLLGIRVAAGRRLDPTLERLQAWVRTRSGNAMWWVVGIIGFLIAADAVQHLGLFPGTNG